MNDKQKNIIDKLNKDNESLNQGHKSMVEYSKGMICVGLFVVCFLIYYFTKNTFFLLGFLSFENDKKILREAVDFLLKNNLIVTKDIPLPQDVQKEMEIKEKLRQERIAQMERQKQFTPPQKSKQQIRYENYKKKQKQKYKENLKKANNITTNLKEK